MTLNYYAPTGGLPGQTELTTNRAVFTESYAVLPRGTMRDIVTSLLPFWDKTGPPGVNVGRFRDPRVLCARVVGRG